MENFAKIVTTWILLTVFVKKPRHRCFTGFWTRLSLSRVSFLLSSMEVATLNRSVFYLSTLSRNFLLLCNRVLFQTCLNLAISNLNGIDKAVLVFLLLTSYMLTCVSAVSTSDNDHQAIGKEKESLGERIFVLICSKTFILRNHLL